MRDPTARRVFTFHMLSRGLPMRLLAGLIALLPSIGHAETHDVRMLTRGEAGAMV